MYNDYFGLKQAPFRITPDTRLFYTGGGRGDVLDALVYAITSGEGIVKVVGEVGTGKTMLCRMLEERLPDNVEIAYLANPSLTPEDILHAVALELGLEVPAGATRLTVMHRLQEELLARHARNQRVVALVEEAQSMPVDTLEEIRLLSNLETKNEKLLQIVLFGQPELDANLAKSEIRQLRERITHSFELKPLARDEVKDYVAFRLRASGYRGRDAFSADAYRVMSRASEGLTRRINIIADKAMLAAFAEDTHDVSARHVKVAVHDSEFDGARGRRRAVPVPAIAAAVTLAVLAAGATGWYAGTRAGAGPGPVVAGPGPVSRAEPAAEPTATPQARQADTGGPAAPGAVLAVAAVVPEAAPGAGQAGAAAEGRAVAQADAAPAAESEAVAPMPVAATPMAVMPAVRAAVPDGAPTAPIATAVQASPVQAAGRVAAVTPRAAPAAAGGGVEPPAARSAEQAPAAAPGVVAGGDAVSSSAPGQAAAGDAVAGVERDATRPTPATPPPESPLAPRGVDPSTLTAAAPPPPVQAAPPRSTRSAAAAPDRDRGDLLERRLAATRAWLGHVNPRHYSIQLLATDAAQRRNLLDFLLRRRRDGHIDYIYVYETRINQRPWFGVLYGEFDSVSEARGVLEELPEELLRHQPFIRNISDIADLG